MQDKGYLVRCVMQTQVDSFFSDESCLQLSHPPLTGSGKSDTFAKGNLCPAFRLKG